MASERYDRPPAAARPLLEAAELWRSWGRTEQGVAIGATAITAAAGLAAFFDTRPTLLLIIAILSLAGLAAAVHRARDEAAEPRSRWGWASLALVGGAKAAIAGFLLFGGSGGPERILLGACAALQPLSYFLLGDFRRMRRAAGTTFDALIAAASISVAIWYALTAPILKQAGASVIVATPALISPPTLILFIALTLLMTDGGEPRVRRFGAFASGSAVASMLAAGAFTRAGMQARDAAPLAYFGWAFATLLVVAGVFAYGAEPRPDGRPAWWREGAERVGRFARAYGHFAAALVAMTEIALFDLFSGRGFAFFTHPEVSVLALLFLVRQAAIVKENVALARSLDSANATLKSLVEHLRSVNSLTTAVTGELAPRPVLEIAAAHVRRVLEADAVYASRERNGRIDVYDAREGASPEVAALVRQGRAQRRLPLQLTQTDETGAPHFAAVTAITWAGEPAGRIIVARGTRAFEFTEIQMLNTVAEAVGRALQNATEHERALDAADRDPVTGLLNHRAFHQRLASVLDAAKRSEGTLALAMIDMNNFKLFNDTYGHLAGDQVLRSVAEALAIETPHEALLARYGGDEFAVALPGCTEDALVALADRARERLRATGFLDPNGTKVPIELSFGIAGFPLDATGRHDLINVADQNLYEAKSSGGGIRRASEHERQNRALRAHASFETLDALVSAVDNKDRYTRKHSEDVTEYALWIAEALGYSEEAKRMIRRAGLLHDVGKIGVPDAILRKPGQLSAEEFEIVQRHPRLGELIVSAIPGMEDIVDGVRSHHERYDGGGYPDRLAGEAIPAIGRLLAVADAFSAMTTDRPYRKGMPWSEAASRIEAGIGSQFDPTFARVFLAILRARDGENRLAA